jgi:hypothetical protein
VVGALSMNWTYTNSALREPRLRMAAASEAIEEHVASRLARSAGMDEVPRMLVDKQIAEIVRVQRRFRALLD